MTQLISLADAPGTRREYETIYILRPNTTNEDVATVNERVKGIIEERDGKVIKVDNWGKRRLAYEVSKERKGIYLYWQYLAGPGVVHEVERNMRMLDSVIRYMTVKIDSDVVADERPTEIDEGSYEKASQTAADEEDLFLAHSGDGDHRHSFSDDDDDDDDDDYSYERDRPASVRASSTDDADSTDEEAAASSEVSAAPEDADSTDADSTDADNTDDDNTDGDNTDDDNTDDDNTDEGDE